jgi:hypothetical protein
VAHELEKLTPFLWRRGPNYLHWCQGCKEGHVYPTARVNGPNWSFNGNVQSPSFTPSMLIYIPAGNYGEDNKFVPQRTRCHYYLTDGRLAFCTDSPHEFSGQTVPLEPIPEDYGF